MSAPRLPIHHDDGSGFEPPELPLDVMMKCDLICTEFERSWQDGQIAPIEGIKSLLQDKPRDERLWLFHYILPLELEYLTDAGEKPIEEEYECHFPEEVHIVRYSFRNLRKSGQLSDPFAETSSFNDEASQTEVGTVICPECEEQISANEIEPGVVTCNLCGSTFVYSRIPSMSGSGMVLPTMIGRYRIVGLLGSGAFGTVYKAEDTRLKNIVALKFPQHWESYSEEGKNRFDREAKAASALVYDHIVRVLNIGEYNGVPYIVCSFIDGTTLAELLRERDEPMPIAEAVSLIQMIAEALHFAHTNKVIHRDVKPGNILVDYAGRPFLTDFGLARWEGDEVTITQADQFLGTWAYASPEQALMKNKEIDGRSDIFSLGIVLYELLTGQRPFQAKNSAGIQAQILTDTPQAPRKLNSKIPKDLETICLKCLEKPPEKRYQTAGELAEDLGHFLKNEPVKARRVSWFERSFIWVRRNPTKVALGIVLIFSGILMTYIHHMNANFEQVRDKQAKELVNQKMTTLNLIWEGAEKANREYLDYLERDKNQELILDSPVDMKNSVDPPATLKEIWRRNSEFLMGCLQDDSSLVQARALEIMRLIIFIDDSAIQEINRLTNNSYSSDDKVKQEAQITLTEILKRKSETP